MGAVSLSGPQSNPPDGITVFCPTPLLTVTMEMSPGGAPELHVHAGGQGFWVARMIAHLGVPVTLCAPFGGDTGRLLKVLIADDGVPVSGVECAGANGAYVHDRRSGERTEICQVAGAKLTRHEYDDLYNATLVSALNSRLLVLTGQFPSPVIPAAAYRRLTTDMHANGRLVIADLSGDDLNEALQGGIDLLCFSHEEMIREKYAATDATRDLIAGLEALQQRGAKRIILHRGPATTIARLDGGMCEVITPHVMPLDHRGGGDTFLAALAAGLVRQQNIEDTIRFAAAAGTLNVTRHGLGTGHFKDIAELSKQVHVRPLNEEDIQ